MSLPVWQEQPNTIPALTDNVIVALVDEYQGAVKAMHRVYGELDAHPILYSVMPKGVYDQGAVIAPIEYAKKLLDCSFWSRLIDLSHVKDVLPSSEMKKWDDQIKDQDVPEFTYETVVSTLQAWFDAQGTFLLDRADTIFHALSDTHITNSPSGFSKRMILKDIWRGGYLVSDNLGPISDLRWLLASLSNRKAVSCHSAYSLVETTASHKGSWVCCDAGSWKLRGYPATGTLHIEIHPEMAWQLNLLLAKRYPLSIASKHRKAPKVTESGPLVLHDLLPLNVANAMFGAKQLYKPRTQHASLNDAIPVINGVILSSKIEKKDPANQSLIRAIDNVIESIGGAVYPHALYPAYVFPYDPIPVLKLIAVEGRLPEKYSHQYFATPAHVAQQAVEVASAGDDGSCQWGELSAGTGNIARLMPVERTTCVEINAVHVAILKSYGLKAIEADFLKWGRETHQRFDRIVINPPYNKNQWIKHVETAKALLSENGKMVCILPAGATRKLVEANSEWHVELVATHNNAFEGAGVNAEVVVIF